MTVPVVVVLVYVNVRVIHPGMEESRVREKPTTRVRATYSPVRVSSRKNNRHSSAIQLQLLFKFFRSGIYV